MSLRASTTLRLSGKLNSGLLKIDVSQVGSCDVTLLCRDRSDNSKAAFESKGLLLANFMRAPQITGFLSKPDLLPFFNEKWNLNSRPVSSLADLVTLRLDESPRTPGSV